jgi:hypothetical protein
MKLAKKVIASGLIALSLGGDACAELVAYWNFDEGTGTMAADSSPNANDGTLFGGPVPTWVAGHTVGAEDFALNFQFGDAPRVAVPTSASLNLITNEFTFATWAFETSSSNYGHLFVTTSDSSNRNWLFQTDNGGDQAYVWSPSDSNWQRPLGWQVPDGAWHHLALTYDGTDLRSYIDGALQNTQGVSVGFPAFNDLYLGGWLAGGSGFIGSLDDMVIFNTVEDVGKIMTGKHPEMLSAPDIFEIIEWTLVGDSITLTWTSSENQFYAIDYSPDLIDWTGELTDSEMGEPGATTSSSFDLRKAGIAIENFERLFFRVREAF